MIIRTADMEKDALAIVDGAKDFFSRMEYTEFLPETDEKLIEAIARVMSFPGIEVIVAEHEGSVVGGLGMMYGPHLWNPNIEAGDEIFFWTSRSAPKTTALRLLREVKARAGDRIVTFKALMTSPKKVCQVYERMGLRPVESSYMGVF